MSATQAIAVPVERTPDVWSRLGNAVADRLNPIVVKEMRQHLRTKTFWIFFSLMLISCLSIAMIAAAAIDESDKVGLFAFLAFSAALTGVGHFVIPYTAYRSMAREQEDETWVLLSLTGMGPRRILAGKLVSFVLQGALYASAAAPFLLFSYYLNGIDLPTIAIAILLGGSWHVFLVAISVSLATLAESRLMRAVLHFVVLGGLGLATLNWLGAASLLSDDVLHRLSKPVAIVAAAGAALGMVTTALLLFEAAAARLSMPTEPYARGPRVVFVVQALGICALTIIEWVVEGSDELLLAGQLVFSAYVAFVGIFIVSDRDSMANSHWAKNSRFALLAPGGLRGFVLVVLVLVVGSSLLIGCNGPAKETSWSQLNVLLAAPCFVLIYLGAPIVIARWIPHPPWQTPVMVRLVAMGVFVIGTGVPPLLGSLFTQADDLLFNALNPIVGLVNVGREESLGLSYVIFVAATAAAVTLGAWLTLLRRDVRPA